MKRCNLMLVILLVLGIASLASAMDKEEAAHGPTAFVPASEYSIMGSCATPVVISSLPFSATGQTNCGLGNNYAATCLGSYDGGEEIIYRLDLATSTTIDIVMNPGTTTWTGMLLDSSCPPNPTTCIAIATGSAASARSILGKTLAAGSYYIMVDTWPTPNCIPSFTLSVTAATPPPPPAANDVCTGAIDIQAQGLSSWLVNLTNAGTYYNDYSLPTTGSCTGYSTPGPDAIYKIDLAAGEQIIVDENGTCDLAVWIATDCANLLTTCVAGADATTTGSEVVTYTAAAAGTYYVVVDAYASAGCPVTVTINAPVATEESSFGALKAMFR